MDSPYLGYIAAAYGVAGATVAWLVVSAWWTGRARSKRLRELERE